ncbi:serine/threonine-protein kinase [Reyranella sp. CPCC 100927]|uniref:serine/threonine-protein kinase n=1 Tax=Reyranella sp. CPCC 100927 TaxID=2599616 RepID=UPI0011B4999E|nr:serine/threonine-protein kinase [Reyranella sp. CPCC 100927]TWT10125.1 protein kinase [Reyranella sp. CPCC 100927]
MTNQADPFGPLRNAAAADGDQTRVMGNRPLAGQVPTTASIAAPGMTAAGATVIGPLPSGDSLLRPGTLLNNTQRIEALIGRGGMGEVYRATNIHTGDHDAIKVIRPDLASDPQVRELFRREAGALRKVRHPSVVSYEGVFGDDSGRLFLVMDFVDGPSLASLIARGPLAPADVRRVGAQVAQGLAAAHSRGVVHRDLSPDNVVLRGGSLDHAVLIDFGVAKRLDGASTLIGSGFAGKLDYCSPEQCGLYDAAVDHRSDIYSLGLVLAAAAVGRPLPMGSSLARAVKARESTPDLSNVPEDLRRDLGRLLEPDPLRRAQSMHEVATLLSHDAPPPAPPAQNAGLLKRLGWLAGGVGVILVLLGIGAFVGPRLIALTSGPPPTADKSVDRTEQPPPEQRPVADAPTKADDAQRDGEARRLAEEQARRQEAERAAAEQRQAAEEAQRRADEDAKRQAAEQQRADDERRRAEEAQRKADDERQLEAQRKADEERRAAAEAQRKADDDKRAAEAQRKADDDKRAAEAQRKADDDKRAAEAQRKADDERRRESAQPAPVVPPAPQPNRPPQQAARPAPAPPPAIVGTDGAWRGRVCFRRIGLTAGNETCGPLSLSIAGGSANGSWVINTVTYGIAGTIQGGAGRFTLDMPPAGRGASLGGKVTLPIRFDGSTLQGQGYANNDVLVQFSATR